MQLFLVDENPDVVTACRQSFAPHPEVAIARGDILSLAHTCIVSPANGYGFMDGGIDDQYSHFFGPRPETELRQSIAHSGSTSLAVGAAVLVRTGHSRIPFMICAPTMTTPGAVPSINAFYAMAAILNAVDRHPSILTTVYCPGLCTGVGAVSGQDAANEMSNAYAKWCRRTRDLPPLSCRAPRPLLLRTSVYEAARSAFKTRVGSPSRPRIAQPLL